MYVGCSGRRYRAPSALPRHTRESETERESERERDMKLVAVFSITTTAQPSGQAMDQSLPLIDDELPFSADTFPALRGNWPPSGSDSGHLPAVGGYLGSRRPRGKKAKGYQVQNIVRGAPPSGTDCNVLPYKGEGMRSEFPMIEASDSGHVPAVGGYTGSWHHRGKKRQRLPGAEHGKGRATFRQ